MNLVIFVVYIEWMSYLFCTKILSKIDSKYLIDLVISGGFLKGGGDKFSEFTCLYWNSQRFRRIIIELTLSPLLFTNVAFTMIV